jgi:hypothetical protein
MVESLFALWAAGGERAEDLDHFRQDKALALLLGHDLPAAQTARAFLAQFHAEDLPLLQQGKANVPAESAPRRSDPGCGSSTGSPGRSLPASRSAETPRSTRAPPHAQ